MQPDPADSAVRPGEEATLRPGVIGFVDALVIGLASTSPAYTLAAIIGALVAISGVHAPGVLLASFVPMVLIASAFAALNRVDPDCGTTFSWVTRAMGPWAGWIGGWAIAMTGVLIVGSLANVGVVFTLRLLGLDSLAGNTAVVLVLTVGLVLLMTWICVLGTELSARLQNVLILAQTGALLVFAGVATYRGVTGDSPLGGLDPGWDWLNPFGAGGAALSGGLLLGVFAYWGWESAVNLTEETRDSTTAPGRAAIASTVVLLVTYVAVAVAVLAFAGTDYLAGNADEEEAVFGLLATEVMGGWDWVVLLSVATAAIASTQTTILPASRTGLSMARRYALPRRFGHVSPRHRTPDVSTWWVGAIASVWFVGVSLVSENALFDSITALSLLIAFYYALTGIACAVYHRRQLTRSVSSLLLIGVGPLVGAGLLVWLLVLSIRDLADPGNSYTGQAWLGVGPPLVIGVGIFVLGLVLMLVWRSRDGRYWRERPGIAGDRIQVDEDLR
ncbi:amino acid transporter [Geodermatophilus tzadiensis]|uniref:Amino acid transporter n=1 Tax=Geodermatophilus tzadiensis TaxID=1137988 RepID=A0A2T0TSD0_9ACTN|nr:APC family permease [Geodermatophilus tzadiensis]PRY48438.1 amino acid transporter [Geodermatophilus tzadiensis]